MKIRMIQMVFGFISDKNITTIVVTHDRRIRRLSVNWLLIWIKI